MAGNAPYPPCSGPSGSRARRSFLPRLRLKRIRKRLTTRAPRRDWDMSACSLEVIVLMILTLGGGLNVLAGLWSSWFSDPIIHGAALIISTVLLMSAVGIPVSYYRTFVIEEQFGFNKMTPQMFFLDLAKQRHIGESCLVCRCSWACCG